MSNEFDIKISPIKLTVERNDIEYEFVPIGEVTDLVKLKNEVAEIMKSFIITTRPKNVVIVKNLSPVKQSFEEKYLCAKDVIRAWYREDPNKEWSSNDLMDEVKFPKKQRSTIIAKLLREKFIRCTNPEGSRNERLYVKAEAMISPEGSEKRDMKRLQEERTLVRDVIG